MNSKKYNTPVVTGALNVLAGLSLIGGGIALLAEMAPQRHATSHAVIAAGILVSGLFYFALSSIVETGSRTAFHAERAADALERMASGPGKTAAKSRRFYIQYPGGDQSSALSPEQLQELLDQGRITEETPLLREGEDQWKTVKSLITK